MANKCPVCGKEFDRRGDLKNHMKSKGHSIDGNVGWVRQNDWDRMARYHREKTAEKVDRPRYG